MAAAYALAFTRSDSGSKALAALAESDDDAIAGIADFSIFRKSISNLRDWELLSVMSYELGRSKRPWTRILLVSYLGDEFKKASTPLFLMTIEKETDPLVRAEMLFQIACYGNEAQLSAAKSFIDRQPSKSIENFYESTSCFLDAVSLNPDKRLIIPLKAFGCNLPCALPHITQFAHRDAR